MTTNGVNFQKAVDYCIKNGATVSESAAKFGVDYKELSRYLSEAMNPNGGGAPEDKLEISNHVAKQELSHAKVKLGTREYTIVAVAVNGEKGASARVYDKNGEQITVDDLKKEFNIRTLSVANDGQINIVVEPDAPKLTIVQNSDNKGSWFDTFANFWRRGNKEAAAGKDYDAGSLDEVVVVANNPNVAKAGGANGVAGGNSVAANGVENGTAVKTMDDVYAQFALDKPQANKAEDAVKNAYAKLSPEDKKKAMELANSAMEKAEAGDVEGAQKDASELDKFMGNVFGGLGLIDLPEEAKVALLVVGIAGLAYAAAEAGVAAVTSKVAQRAAAVFMAMGLTSCSGDDLGGKTEINQNVNITITQNSSLEDAIDALLQGQEVTNAILQKILEREIENGATAKEILDLCGGNAKMLSKILEAMTENNNLLAEVKNSINSGTENIMNALVDIKGSVDTLTELVKAFPQYTSQLNEIINGIKTGNKTMSEMKGLIAELLKKTVANGDTQVNILNKLTEIENSNKSDGEKLAAMLKLLAEMKLTLDGIAGDLKTHFKNDAKVNGYLEKILEETKKNNTKADETNALLQKLYTLVEKLGSKGDAMGKEILNYIAAVGFEMNGNFSKLIDAVNNGNVKLDNITALLQKINANVVKNGEDGKKLGDEILNYIAAVGFEMNGNFSKLLDAVNKGNVKLDNITALLEKINANVVKNGENGKKLGDEILNYIAAVGFEMNGNFSKLLDAVNKGNVKIDSVIALLEKINANVVKNGENGKKLGDEILNYIAAVGFEMNGNFSKLLDAVNKGNVNLNDIKELIAQLNTQVKQNGEDGKQLGNDILNTLNALGFEMNRNFTAVLEAINKGVAGADSLRSLLEKVVDNQGKNTKAILEAIGNIKITNGGTVNLSSLEKMVSELLAQSKKNGNILSSINGKTDVLNATTKSILQALQKEVGKNDNRYTNIMNILNVIASKTGNKGDDSKLLAKLDKILAKLDEIKNAIKDHKVTVDVTGKVECKCNCGKNHEGILGDLNDILS